MGQSSKIRTPQRVVNACVRCRHHKIKCSGSSPCTHCQRRKASCVFAGEEPKVQITKRRLSELKQRTYELEKENLALQERLKGKQNAANIHEPTRSGACVDHEYPDFSFSTPGSTSDTQVGVESPEIQNSLSTGPAEFIRDITGDLHHLGHTSNWSLTMRLLQMTHQNLYNSPCPNGAHHVDSMTYDFGWNGIRHAIIPNIRGLPSLDHALFLIKATEFHTSPMFHLFDEKTFMAKLYWFYEDPVERVHLSGLWFIHLLVLLALGKAFHGSKGTGNTPPGADLFARAFMLLPDYCYLWKEPCIAGELLSSIALYLQSIDWRTSAHNMISQAQRILLVHGFHASIHPDLTDMAEQTRRRKIWWTVFILERRLSVLMGFPLGIRDQDILTPPPSIPESQSQAEAAIVHVKLSKAFGHIVDTIYHGSGALGSTFVKTAQGVLHDVANVASELGACLPLPGCDSMNGISRHTAYMNLFYHDCIILSTRPFLFNLVEKCIHPEVLNAPVPASIKGLIEICIESARKTAYILEEVMDQSLLDCFLPFHLESTVSAGLVITMALMINPAFVEVYSQTMQTLFRILDKMIDGGNLIAVDQKNELIELQNNRALLQPMNNSMTPDQVIEAVESPQRRAEGTQGIATQITDDHIPYIDAGQNSGRSGPPSMDLGRDKSYIDPIFDMSPSQIMSVVDLLNTDDLIDWITLSNDGG